MPRVKATVLLVCCKKWVFWGYFVLWCRFGGESSPTDELAATAVSARRWDGGGTRGVLGPVPGFPHPIHPPAPGRVSCVG